MTHSVTTYEASFSRVRKMEYCSVGSSRTMVLQKCSDIFILCNESKRLMVCRRIMYMPLNFSLKIYTNF
jgi:hypothetical protein